MKKYITLFIALICAAAGMTAAADTGTFTRGTPVEFTFTVPADIGSGPVEGCRLVLFKGPLAEPELKMMYREGDEWRTTVTVTDTAVKVLFYAFKVHINGRLHGPFFPDGEDYSILLAAGPDGRPVRSAHELTALSYTAAGALKREDASKALEAVERELDLYPLNLSARRLKYSIILTRDGADDWSRRSVINDAEEFLKAFPDDPDVLSFAAEAFSMAGDQEEADRITGRIIERFPLSDAAAAQKFEAIVEIEDAGAKADSLEAFIGRFSATRYYEYALTALADALIELNDQSAMAATGERLLEAASTPAAAGGLAGIAGVLSEMNYNRERAEVFAQKAVDLIQDAASMPHPPEMEESEWRAELQKTEARYLDILGWIQVQRGELLTGLANLDSAAGKISEPGVFYHLGATRERLGHTEDALTAYARGAVFDGDIGELSYNAFMTLWKNDGRSDAGAAVFLDQQGNYIELLFKNRVLARRVDRDAPDFELEDIQSGDVIRLSDQKGTPTVICFWAAWSRSSHYMLQGLDEMADLYGRDVLFMTIATDKDMKRLRSYLRRYRVSFPVLISEDTDVDYGIKGVPMLYVLDKTLKTQFIHRGYRPDLTETLTVELDELLR